MSYITISLRLTQSPKIWKRAVSCVLGHIRLLWMGLSYQFRRRLIWSEIPSSIYFSDEFSIHTKTIKKELTFLSLLKKTKNNYNSLFRSLQKIHIYHIFITIFITNNPCLLFLFCQSMTARLFLKDLIDTCPGL